MPSKLFIKKRYNKLWGKIYDIRYKEEQQAKFNLINQYLKFKQTDIIIDNGCGTGILLSQLKNTAIGIDFSINLLITARSKTKKHPNKHLVQSDVENLPFKDEIADQTLSITVIQNTPIPFDVLTEMHRVTKKKGTITITAHRKTIKKHKMEKLINKTNLLIKTTINDHNINDIITITEKK